uniref:CRC domain-containing protein n=1 Tax=Peronospora matthiolae TaxID=2874970 RepID=A0AAV1VGL9_9STRA
MDRHGVRTHHEMQIDLSTDAQENKDPNGIRIAAKLLQTAPKQAINRRSAPRSSTTDCFTPRRALHSIDSNCVLSAMDSTRRGQLDCRSFDVKDPAEAAKSPQKASRSTPDTPVAGKELVTDRNNRVTSAENAANLLTSSCRQLELQESENLAWMDMMLALLEKRYGSTGALPVSLTDLEAANMFNLSWVKSLKTGFANEQALSKRSRSLDDTKTKTLVAGTFHEGDDGRFSLSSSRCLQQQHLLLHLDQESEQTKASKRQRLALRHAQQIQVSSAASVSSCGCKTGCLKMYCTCFSSRGFCHDGCACDECKNSHVNKAERVDAIQKYLVNDPRAFSFALVPRDAVTTGFLHLLPEKSSTVVMRGCRCQKSKCMKKYCECFQNGVVCTSHCRCVSCSNNSDALSLQTEHHARAYVERGARSESVTSKPKAFHSVQITVTKQPRRNHVGKTLRLNL